jgi:hypothetical protein
MKSQKQLIFVLALALMAAAFGALVLLKSHPRLGKPGLKGTPIPGSLMMKLDLPARVLDCVSTNVPEPEVVLGYLPPDSSFAERHYQAPDGFDMTGTLILMGADRTSIHNADYCLAGQGLATDAKKTVTLSIGGAQSYRMPVSVWNVSRTVTLASGQTVKISGVYVFWFVADGEQTPSHFEMMKRLALHLLTTGVMQRWAYVSYFSLCEPGQEDAVFARMAKVIAASVPEFQHPPARRQGSKN